MIRCEDCNLAISDGDMIGHVGLCPWCWELEWNKYQEQKEEGK